MEYQPFDFDKLDALLRECEALSGDSRRLTRNPLAARVRLIPSTTALATGPIQRLAHSGARHPGQQFAGSTYRAGYSGGAPIA